MTDQGVSATDLAGHSSAKDGNGGSLLVRDDKTRLAKSDADLLRSIGTGLDVKGMPAFEAILSVPQRKAVLAYIRENFGDKK